jgi:hypothetical protein
MDWLTTGVLFPKGGLLSAPQRRDELLAPPSVLSSVNCRVLSSGVKLSGLLVSRLGMYGLISVWQGASSSTANSFAIMCYRGGGTCMRSRPRSSRTLHCRPQQMVTLQPATRCVCALAPFGSFIILDTGSFIPFTLIFQFILCDILHRYPYYVLVIT